MRRKTQAAGIVRAPNVMTAADQNDNGMLAIFWIIIIYHSTVIYAVIINNIIIKSSEISICIR